MPPLGSIGVPTAFLQAYLEPMPQLVRIKQLAREFERTEGYAFAWGVVIEERVGTFIRWRVIPTTIWTAAIPAEQAFEDLIAHAQPEVLRRLEEVVPRHLTVVSSSTAPRLHAHTLFGLLLTNPTRLAATRQWIVDDLLPALMPKLLLHIRIELLGDRRRTHASAG